MKVKKKEKKEKMTRERDVDGDVLMASRATTMNVVKDKES